MKANSDNVNAAKTAAIMPLLPDDLFGLCFRDAGSGFGSSKIDFRLGGCDPMWNDSGAAKLVLGAPHSEHTW